MCTLILVVQGDHRMWSRSGECRGEWGCERAGVNIGFGNADSAKNIR